MLHQVLLASLISFAAAQYGNKYENPSYSNSYAPYYESKPQPYNFGYDIKDDYGATQNRKEEADSYGNVKGSYGYTDGYGLYRHVDYVADDKGFRAYVKTNEPGTDNQDPADAQIQSYAAPIKYDGPSQYGKASAYSKYAGSSYNKPAPSYNKPATSYNQPAPSYHQPSPYYNQPAPSYNKPAPSYNRPAFTYNKPSSTYNQPAQSYNQPAPY